MKISTFKNNRLFQLWDNRLFCLVGPIALSPFNSGGQMCRHHAFMLIKTGSSINP
ncbi:hypothetical protein FC95_GL001980 [Lentilactobacillus kefiri DSM 20587 = JCM 5818]|uniref:Uncharacterized protein n=1 Tax=Lentilactobacillus kefiri DSM 20587 = JCM 5818 TaxID=1423764 RepID=A0A8E1RIS9_LENKE|nr:hypothetical protein FD08_GL004544 [Lentilactobacillus parakefiri DSM 10551]KRM50528.1 hypothetical protein FC95_GL001980 [Lentilactobacillus kefiri DSM 20587 = JCM 5818]